MTVVSHEMSDEPKVPKQIKLDWYVPAELYLHYIWGCRLFLYSDTDLL